MKLMNSTKNTLLAQNLERASGFWSRLKGLMGRETFATDAALEIPHCPSIHTFFMNFPIDVVFVDRKNQVRACFANVRPWRYIAPIWGAHTAYEFTVGKIAETQTEVGDQLHVAN